MIRMQDFVTLIILHIITKMEVCSANTVFGSVRSSSSGNLCLSVPAISCPELSILHLCLSRSLSGLSQVFSAGLVYFVGHTLPKILGLVL